MAKGRFDRWAPWYDASALQPLLYLPVHEAVVRCAQRHLRRPRRILDVGCGTGRLLCRSARYFPGAVVVGVDASIAMVGRTQAAAPRDAPVAVVQAHAEHLPFADAVFDLIVVTLSMRHWNDPDAGLAEIGRVMSSSGLLVLADIFGTPRHRWWCRLWRHRLTCAPEPLRSTITAAGLIPVGADLVLPAGPIPPVAILAVRRPPRSL